MSQQSSERIAVLLGGTSSERAVSLRSGQAVLEALLARGVDAFSIDMGEDRIAQLQAATFDRAFIIEHGGFGEDGRLQALLEIMGSPSRARPVLPVPWRWISKSPNTWRGLSLPVADSVILQADSDFGQVYDRLGPKIMVKPVSEGLASVFYCAQLGAIGAGL